MSRIRTQNRKILILHILLLSVFVILIAFATFKYGPSVTRLASEPDKFKELINSYGYISVPVFIFFQILQVVVAAIPGEVVQVAGGYIFGTFLGTLYLIIGVILGSSVAFYASRLLGYPVVKGFVPADKLEKFNFLLAGPKSDAALFVLFLIPGLPKDVLTYIAGLAPVKPLRFLLITTTARLPALFVSSYIGANLQEKNYPTVIILSVVAILLFFAGVVLKDRIIFKIQKLAVSRRTE